MQLQAEKIKKKHKNLKRKTANNKQKNINKPRTQEDDTVFRKKIPRKTDDITFIKQVSAHPRDRLKRKTKT